jgi:esterase/lipase superfamily enzyme
LTGKKKVEKKKRRKKKKKIIEKTYYYREAPVVSVDQSLGRHHRFYESGHVDSVLTVLATTGKGNVGTSKSVSLQDYHDILSKIMEGMAKIR